MLNEARNIRIKKLLHLLDYFAAGTDYLEGFAKTS